MSISHWLIVLFVILLLFGPKKLGNLGQSLGEGIRGLREGLDDKKAQDDVAKSDKPLPPGDAGDRA